MYLVPTPMLDPLALGLVIAAFWLVLLAYAITRR